MAQFKYLAIADDGTKLRATAEALSAEELRSELLARRLEVVRIHEKKALSKIEITRERVPPADIMHFCRQTAAFVRAGIPIVDAMAVIRESSKNGRFRRVLQEAAEGLQAGLPLSESLRSNADIFPPYFLGILRSAEITGQLDIVLDQLSGYMERDLEARSRVKSALTYPMVVLVMSIVTVVILVAFVLPRFTEFFKSFKAELPLPTRILLNFSRFTQEYWYVLVGCAVAAAMVVWWLRRTVPGRVLKDRSLLRIPVVREVVQYAILERFCRIVGAMMRAGVPLPEGMQAAVDGTTNVVYRRALTRVRERMLEGEGMADPIAETALFPPAAVQMIRVGEETGTLDVQLDSAGQYYARELEYKLTRLTTLFEPAVIVFMGVIVGFVAVALVSAMYGVFNSSDLK
jgi:type IV pilus assembly protein PilC